MVARVWTVLLAVGLGLAVAVTAVEESEPARDVRNFVFVLGGGGKGGFKKAPPSAETPPPSPLEEQQPEPKEETEPAVEEIVPVEKGTGGEEVALAAGEGGDAAGDGEGGGRGEMDGAALAGAALAGVAGIAVVALVVGLFVVRRRRRRAAEEMDEETQAETADASLSLASLRKHQTQLDYYYRANRPKLSPTPLVKSPKDKSSKSKEETKSADGPLPTDATVDFVSSDLSIDSPTPGEATSAVLDSNACPYPTEVCPYVAESVSNQTQQALSHQH